MELERFFYDSNEKHREVDYLVLVIYDIPDNRRRVKFARFLESYGFRVQKSAFEARLNRVVYDQLLSSIPLHITKEDNVRMYRIKGMSEVTAWGSEIRLDDDLVII